MAPIAVSKFADGLPLYRQQKIFDRLGIELPRATMANWDKLIIFIEDGRLRPDNNRVENASHPLVCFI